MPLFLCLLLDASPSKLISLSTVDLTIIAIYFVAVLWIGYYLKGQSETGEDFFLAGREMTAWIAGLSFPSANLGSLELMGWAAAAYQYGILAAHWYWIGAIPAMLFLGIVMMPFYYISKTHSVPGYLKLRFGESSRALAAGCATNTVGGPSANKPGARDAGEELDVRMGVVEEIRRVPLPSSPGYIGTFGGATAGGIAGVLYMVFCFNRFIIAYSGADLPELRSLHTQSDADTRKLWEFDAEMNLHHSLEWCEAAVPALLLAALGTVWLVLSSRRATLNQINLSLAEISEQLRPMRQARRPPEGG